MAERGGHDLDVPVKNWVTEDCCNEDCPYPTDRMKKVPCNADATLFGNGTTY